MKMTAKEIAYLAFYLALFVVLDYLANTLPLFKMPYGGTLGLGVIALLLASYHLGYKKGLLVGSACVLLQFITGEMYIISFIQFLLDYFLAFTIYGFAVLLGRYQGIIVTNTLRYLFHVISGVLFFGMYAGEQNVVVYSLVYNRWYMIPTTVLCLMVVPLISDRIKEL